MEWGEKKEKKEKKSKHTFYFERRHHEVLE